MRALSGSFEWVNRNEKSSKDDIWSSSKVSSLLLINTSPYTRNTFFHFIRDFSLNSSLVYVIRSWKNAAHVLFPFNFNILVKTSETFKRNSRSSCSLVSRITEFFGLRVGVGGGERRNWRIPLWLWVIVLIVLYPEEERLWVIAFVDIDEEEFVKEFEFWEIEEEDIVEIDWDKFELEE